MFVYLFHPELESGKKAVSLNTVPETLKNVMQGCFRSSYFFEAEVGENFASEAFAGKIPLIGSFNLTFCIRKAKDILLEGCEYPDLNIQLQVGGRVLPELPSRKDIEKALNQEDTIILVNDSPFKPETEVFGFQKVYDDSVKCIEILKKMGIPQETMALYATPEEISVEVHPGVMGLAGDPFAWKKYHNLLCYVAGVKNVSGKLHKGDIKTIVVQSSLPDYQVLLPGSTHPLLHRPKVGVGASHFAYGTAAFSDFCGKKRSVEECLQETFNWMKFVQTQIPPIAGMKEKIEALSEMPIPGVSSGKSSAGSARGAIDSGGFQPLGEVLVANQESFLKGPECLTFGYNSLEKAIGGGWQKSGVHLIVGNRENGKATFLSSLALKAVEIGSVLYLSLEHSQHEFLTRMVVNMNRVNRMDLLGQIAMKDETGVAARKTLARMVGNLAAKLGSAFFYRGSDSGIDSMDVDEISQFIGMLPESDSKTLFIDSIPSSIFCGEGQERLTQLKQLAVSQDITIFLSVHESYEESKKPHYIEQSDCVLLEKYQGFVDNLIVLGTEKVNLRKFVAMMKGQIDPQLVGKLEQMALQAAGGKRLKSDSYSLFKVIHTRSGRREVVLYLYQQDFSRFFELGAIQIGRN